LAASKSATSPSAKTQRKVTLSTMIHGGNNREQKKFY
jgi:hypothetical protein